LPTLFFDQELISYCY